MEQCQWQYVFRKIFVCAKLKSIFFLSWQDWGVRSSPSTSWCHTGVLNSERLHRWTSSSCAPGFTSLRRAESRASCGTAATTALSSRWSEAQEFCFECESGLTYVMMQIRNRECSFIFRLPTHEWTHWMYLTCSTSCQGCRGLCLCWKMCGKLELAKKMKLYIKCT